MEEENIKKSKKGKKPVTLKTIIIRRIIFLIIFAIISVGITTYFIIENPFEKQEKKTSSKEEASDNEVASFERKEHTSVLDYDNDTFNLNDLEVNTIEENFEGYDIQYSQISGLKDTSIQEKINKTLENDIKDIITNAKNAGELKGDFSSGSFVYSNFANTLSIGYTLSSSIYNKSTYEYTYFWDKEIYENFDLTTGNKIKIQDLFTDDTLGSDLFDSSFYSELIRSYTDQEFDEQNYYYKITDYNDIEEKILQLITDFNLGNDIPFYFDEQKVVIPESYSRIFFDEHLDYIAIYDKYKTSKSIFDGKYPHLHNLPVLTQRYPSYYQILEEGENYYIDINLSDIYIDDEDKETIDLLTASAKLYMDTEVEKMREEAEKDGKFIIYNYSYSVTSNSKYDSYTRKFISDGTYEFRIETAKMKTTKSLFNSELKKKIQDVFRKAVRIEGGDAHLYNNQFFYYMYDEDYDYDKIEQDWERDTINLYMDKYGNIFETQEEALNSKILGTED